jgi:hypothetical protein
MEQKEATVSKEIIAHDFRNAAHGKMDKETIHSITSTMMAATTGYAANGSIASMIFYIKVGVSVTDGKSFQGDGGGAFTPGGGALFGTIYTDDLNSLYANTVSFQINATSVYVNINFFDSNSNLLGHFQSGAVSTVNGIGGGKGSWS